MLAATDSRTRCVFTIPSPVKGAANLFAVKELAKAVEFLGYRRLIVKCDDESVINDIRRNLKRHCTDCEILVEDVPVGESQSNAEIESHVGAVGGLCRTLRSALVSHYGEDVIHAKHPILTWLVQYAGSVYTTFNLGVDGKSGYQRARGRPYRVPDGLPEFG